MEQSFNIVGWNGGTCPLHPKTEVRVWLRNGIVNKAAASALVWDNNRINTEYNIIAYQVVTPYVEPKVIWVNEYGEGRHYAYDTEIQAKTEATKSTKRTAVKYQEVRD